MKDAAPSVPVEVLGFSSLPEPGDVMVVVSDEKTARGLAEKQASQRSQLDRTKALTLEEIQTRISTGEVKELNLIAKADVQGSLEAIRTSLEKLGTGPTKIRFLHTGSGTITESDILLASASKAIVIGFNTSVEPGAQKLADREGVQIRRYDIIYHLIEDVEKALKGILTPREVEAVVGKAEVRNVFPAGKLGKVAGCMILEGSITRGINIRVLRGGKAVAQTTVASLRRFKEDVNEVAAGYECGVGLDGFNDFLQGDIIEAFRTQRANS